MQEIRVDPEFQNKIPPLTKEEFEQLRDNILDDGEVFEPICLWKGIIVDGHNRWKIIQENPDIPYKTREMIFMDKWEAFDWMFRKQLGRRNLTSEQRLRLIGQMHETRKKLIGAPTGNSNAEKQLGQNEPIVFAPRSTAEAIAREVGVSESTVKRAEKFSKGIDALEKVSKEAADKVLRGGSGVTRSTIMELPKMEPEKKDEVVRLIIEGRPMRYEVDETDVEDGTEYSIESLLAEIRANAAEYVQTLRKTLAQRSQCYQEPDDRKRVLEAIQAIKRKIENLEEVIKL